MGNNRSIYKTVNSNVDYDDALKQIGNYINDIDNIRDKFLNRIIISRTTPLLKNITEKSINDISNSKKQKGGANGGSDPDDDSNELNEDFSYTKLEDENIEDAKEFESSEEKQPEINLSEEYNKVFNIGFAINSETEKISNIKEEKIPIELVEEKENKVGGALTIQLSYYQDLRLEILNDLKDEISGYFQNSDTGLLLKDLITDIYILYKVVYNKKINKNIKKRCSPSKMSNILKTKIPDATNYFIDKTETNLVQIDNWNFKIKQPGGTNKTIKLSDKFMNLVNDSNILKRRYLTKELPVEQEDECNKYPDHTFFKSYDDLVNNKIIPNVYYTNTLGQQKNYDFVDYDNVLNKDYSNCNHKMDETLLEQINLNKIYQLKISLLTSIQQQILNQLYTLFKQLVDYSDDKNIFEKFFTSKELNEKYEYLINIILLKKDDNDESLLNIVSKFYNNNGKDKNTINTNELKKYTDNFNFGIIKAENLYLELLNDNSFFDGETEIKIRKSINRICEGSRQYYAPRSKNLNDKTKVKTDYNKYSQPNIELPKSESIPHPINPPVSNPSVSNPSVSNPPVSNT